jgi:hypothetical protein
MKIILLFVFLISFNLRSQTADQIPVVQPGEKAPIDTTFHEVLMRGLNHTSNFRFSAALAMFDSLQKHFPNHPAPHFYKTATYQSWMLTYRFNLYQNELFQNAKLAIEKGTELLKKDNDPWLNFYVGAAYGFVALHRFRKHNWVGAFLDGRKSINNLKTALEKSPNLYDCYFGLGSYHYWRSAKYKFIKFLIFWMEDKREVGLEQLRFSVEHGRYCPYEAIHGLVIAYYHHGEYAKALELNDIAMNLNEIPSLGTLYMRGRLMAWYEKWPAVLEIFQEILQRLEAQPYSSIGYQVECKYWIAEALKNQNHLKKSHQMVIDALTQSKKRIKKNELESAFENFDDIKKRLLRLNEDLQKLWQQSKRRPETVKQVIGDR